MAMPAPAPEGAPQAAPGGASELVAKIHDLMMQLQDMEAQANIPEAQELAALVSGFQAHVEKLGQSAEGAPAEEGPQGPAQAPVESGGNPNAKPY